MAAWRENTNTLPIEPTGSHLRENALVVEGRIGNILLRRILIDNGSSVNLMTLDKFRALGGSVIDMKLVSTPLLGLGWSLV